MKNTCKKKKEEMNMTYEELAKEAGLPVRTVLYFFSEKCKEPSCHTVAAIFRALHLSIDKFFGLSI